MDLHPTPFLVKSQFQTTNRRTTRKIEVQTTDAKDRSLLPREKPVFGTSRNPNIPPKAAHEKPAKGTIRSSLNTRARKNLSPSRPEKKSVSFQENEVKRNGKYLDDVNVPHTPVNAVMIKPRVATPYHNAEKFSKCRVDKLETASYWLSHIKLAESVGKHSVSAAFFGLAFECNAESICNLRVELRKYLGRHGHLNEGVEWRKVKVRYGMVKVESCTNGEEDVKAVVEEANAEESREVDHVLNL